MDIQKHTLTRGTVKHHICGSKSKKVNFIIKAYLMSRITGLKLAVNAVYHAADTFYQKCVLFVNMSMTRCCDNAQLYHHHINTTPF